MEQTAFLGLMLAGVLALVAGMFRVRTCWRPDGPAYGRATRAWDVFLHPERYAEQRAVRAARTLFFAGFVGIAGALAVLAHKALHDLSRAVAP